MIFGEVLTISASLISLSRVSFSLRDPRELVFAAGSRHHAADPEFLIVALSLHSLLILREQQSRWRYSLLQDTNAIRLIAKITISNFDFSTY